MLPRSEVHQVLAVQCERGHLIADGLFSSGCRFPYRLTKCFEDDLNVSREGRDVGIDGLDWFVADRLSIRCIGMGYMAWVQWTGTRRRQAGIGAGSADGPRRQLVDRARFMVISGDASALSVRRTGTAKRTIGEPINAT